MIAVVVIWCLAAQCSCFVGRDFFPLIDGGQIQLHVRAPAGTRIEATETRLPGRRGQDPRRSFPRTNAELIVDNIGLPARAYNLAFTDGSTIGANDGVILVALKEGHAPTAGYVAQAARGAAGSLSRARPSIFRRPTWSPRSSISACRRRSTCAPSATIATTNLRVAKELRRRIAAIPGVADAHLQQEVDAPAFYADDRPRPGGRARPQRAVPIANNINVSLSSSEQVTPNFWTDPATGIPYYLAVQTPRASAWPRCNALSNTPVSHRAAPTQRRSGAGPAQQCGDAHARQRADQFQPGEHPAGIRGLCQRSGPRSRQCRQATSTRSSPSCKRSSSPATSIQVVGQIQSMNDAFRDLGIGLLFAAVFVYLLMVVNYQNFGDPFVVILALPATFCGILTMLFITGTTLSVPSLMGAIMAVGVASANSILLVTFAREQQLAGRTAFEAAIDAGHTRIRPVLMTAAAMIVGMLPMAIGGAGEEQNAALGARRHRRAPVRDADDPARRALPVRHAAEAQRRQDATMAYFRRMSRERGREVRSDNANRSIEPPAEALAEEEQHPERRGGGRWLGFGVLAGAHWRAGLMAGGRPTFAATAAVMATCRSRKPATSCRALRVATVKHER